MGRNLHKKEKIKEYPCRCGGSTKLVYQDERSGGVLIKHIPVLVCKKCKEEWYPPGIPRMIEGVREAAKNVGEVKISAEALEAV